MFKPKKQQQKTILNKTILNKTILIMAGGTGGHIFPALAVARALQNHSIKIEWLGSTHGMECDLVPKHGFNLHRVNSVGLRGKKGLHLLKAPFLLGWAFLQTLKLFIQLRPDIVLGMGGFASGIGGLVARLFFIPLFIHEQNTVAGTTNRILARIATRIFQAFDHTFEPAQNLITVGNPVLFEPLPKITSKSKFRLKFRLKFSPKPKLNVLIIGGSLGAKPINDIVSQLTLEVNLWHQTGAQHLHSVRANYLPKSAKITAFIDDMATAYAWADVVICRAGAMTVTELMHSGSASILIPLPHAIDNHQFYNAQFLENNDAGILIEQKDFSLQKLSQTLTNLTTENIQTMQQNAHALSRPDSVKIIADAIEQSLNLTQNSSKH